MSLPVVFRRAARDELDSGIDWYEARRAGLGDAFADAVELVVGAAAAQPDFYAAVYGNTREALVAGYPYCVYYREDAGRLIVLSVFHTSRDPSVWQRRV